MIKGEEIVERPEGDLEELYRGVGEIEEGQIVKGKVLSVGGDFVIVDIGYKSEGRIPLKEFVEEDGGVK